MRIPIGELAADRLTAIPLNPTANDAPEHKRSGRFPDLQQLHQDQPRHLR